MPEFEFLSATLEEDQKGTKNSTTIVLSMYATTKPARLRTPALLELTRHYSVPIIARGVSLELHHRSWCIS